MKNYIISVSNFKMTGESDSASTQRFLITVKDESIEFFAALSIVSEEVQKKNFPGLSSQTMSSGVILNHIDDLNNLGKPWITNDRFEIRKLG